MEIPLPFLWLLQKMQPTNSRVVLMSILFIYHIYSSAENSIGSIFKTLKIHVLSAILPCNQNHTIYCIVNLKYFEKVLLFTFYFGWGDSLPLQSANASYFYLFAFSYLFIRVLKRNGLPFLLNWGLQTKIESLWLCHIDDF